MPEQLAFNMDCLEAMRQMEDNAFDLAVVDPPYGVGAVTYMPRERKKAFGGYIDTYTIIQATLDANQRKTQKVNVCNTSNAKSTINNFGDENVSPEPEYFEQLFRVSKNQIIWGGKLLYITTIKGIHYLEKTHDFGEFFNGNG